MRYKIFQRPRRRDVHQKPMPRLGGLAIFSSFLLVSLFCFLFIYRDVNFNDALIWGVDKRYLGMILGGSIVALTMTIDDILGLSAWQKISIQVFSALILISSGIGINTLANPFGQPLDLNSVYIPIIKIHGIIYHFSLWSDLLTIVWVVGMMNVINFVDGVDGLAGGLSVIASITIFFLSLSIGFTQNFTALISIILAGSILGFLFWNFPPAKIFMGDSGSMFIGFLLGALPLLSGGKLATVFLVLGFPIIDGLFVATGRLVRRKNPFTTPDKTHLHHRFLSAGFTARQSIITLCLIATAFGWVALRSTTMDKVITSFVLVILICVLILSLKYTAKKRMKNAA